VLFDVAFLGQSDRLILIHRNKNGTHNKLASCANYLHRQHNYLHPLIRVFLKGLKTVPSSFAPSTTRTLRALFLSSDSGSRFRFKLCRITLELWPIVGRVVDREGWQGVFWKRNRGLVGNIRGEVRNVRM
jgi:hypothetical protein